MPGFHPTARRAGPAVWVVRRLIEAIAVADAHCEIWVFRALATAQPVQDLATTPEAPRAERAERARRTVTADRVPSGARVAGTGRSESPAALP